MLLHSDQYQGHSEISVEDVRSGCRDQEDEKPFAIDEKHLRAMDATTVMHDIMPFGRFRSDLRSQS